MLFERKRERLRGRTPIESILESSQLKQFVREKVRRMHGTFITLDGCVTFTQFGGCNGIAEKREGDREGKERRQILLPIVQFSLSMHIFAIIVTNSDATILIAL